MPRLRITTVFSVLAVLLGVAGTALLSRWPRMQGATVVPEWVAHAPTLPVPPPRRAPRSLPPPVVAAPAPVPQRPRPLYAPAPRYPISALRAHREGVVMLDVQLDGAGLVTAADVAGSSGDSELDQAALEAVRHWTFQLPDAARPQLLRLPVRFRIGGADGPG